MDPSYPKERLQYILEDSKATIVLTQESLVGVLPSFAGRAICLDKDWAKIANESDRNPSGLVNPEDLAYVLFTSGSTGRPKGVEISHRAVINFLNSMRETPGLIAQDTLLSVTTLAFDISGLEVWLPLTSGAKVVIVPEDVAKDRKALAELIRQSGATVMQATPSTWRLLLESGWEGSPHLKILCGGEAWPAELAEQLLPKCTSLWNMYGPTETTIWSAVHQVKSCMPVFIGHPIANTEFYVVDTLLQPVPVGVPGELLIGGAGVARGYLNRPELTAEKFIADPFQNETGSRLYCTGDLVRYRVDGTLEFLGRIDQQVKMRGFRIELGEIESVLRSHAAVREAVVVMREEREKQLVAYVVLAGEPSCTTAELRDYLKQKLPVYMVPTAFSVLENIPLTPNGKVDRKALSGADYIPSERQSARDLVLPQTLLEMQLLQIWERILGSRNIGVRDNFFEIGGHSLLAVSIITEINNLLDVNLAIPIFFLNPSIRGIARTLEEEKNRTTVSTLVPLRPSHNEGTLYFVEASMGMCRLAERLDAAEASFAAVVPISSAILEAAVEGRSADLPNLEAMAAPYAELIGTHQASGPRVLIGHSFRGALAFEVAHQLQRQGKRVDMVVLLDASMRVPWWDRLKKLTYRRLRWAINWRLGRVRNAAVEWARALFPRSPHTPGPVTSDSVRGQLYRPFAAVPWEILHRILVKASHSYRGRQLKSVGILFRAQETDRHEHFADMGWGGLFSEGLEIVNTPGDHMSLLEDANLDHLSQVLRERLARLVNR
ncbi:MAG: amino acid adenylation domain-containing protein [Candidatus Sulfotelmatobacter sp.]